MQITLVVAMDKNRLIGRNNALPWHLPRDLAHFKAVTLGKPIIMGRRTFESIGKPLPKRLNCVITRQKKLTFAGCEIFYSLDESLKALSSEAEVMIIGGAHLFEIALPKATKMILTLIEHTFDGDTYFPEWDPNEWTIMSKTANPADLENPYAFSFVELVRQAME